MHRLCRNPAMVKTINFPYNRKHEIIMIAFLKIPYNKFKLNEDTDYNTYRIFSDQVSRQKATMRATKYENITLIKQFCLHCCLCKCLQMEKWLKLRKRHIAIKSQIRNLHKITIDQTTATYLNMKE